MYVQYEESENQNVQNFAEFGEMCKANPLNLNAKLSVILYKAMLPKFVGGHFHLPSFAYTQLRRRAEISKS